MPAERIVTLLPAATEIVCALGLEERLVGRSHECDFPGSVRGLPVLTEARLDPDAPGAEIDARVRGLVRDGLSIYRVDAEALRRLRPDAIVTQTQCDVCAASPRDLEQALEGWIGSPPRLVSLAPASLGDVWGDLQRVADALGVPERGGELAAALARRVSDVAERALRVKTRPRVACIEWIEPLMAAGNWVPELVTLAGGEPLLGATGEHSPWLAFAELAEADPDAIVVMPCGFDRARTRRELAPLEAESGWQGLRAVRSGRVYAVDGNAFFNRPGPRLVESVEILAELLHPDVFAPRREGVAWERVDAAGPG